MLEWNNGWKTLINLNLFIAGLVSSAGFWDDWKAICWLLPFDTTSSPIKLWTLRQLRSVCLRCIQMQKRFDCRNSIKRVVSIPLGATGFLKNCQYFDGGPSMSCELFCGFWTTSKRFKSQKCVVNIYYLFERFKSLYTNSSHLSLPRPYF